MKTEETNKLVAEFMEHKPKFEVYIDDVLTTLERPIKNYHSDWNWLMEVVEKIESLGYRTLAENECFMITKSKLEPFDVRSKDDYSTIFSDNYEINHYGSTKLTNTYTAVVEFIIWYNSAHKN